MKTIDKHEMYVSNAYRYKNFVQLTEEEKRMVLEWRNHESVRKWMYNTEIIPLENHLKFIDSLNNRTDCYYWMVYKNDEPDGVISIVDVDYENGRVEPGCYRNPVTSKPGEGLDFFWNFYDFLFRGLEVEECVGGIAVDNVMSILLNSYLGVQHKGKKTLLVQNQFKEFYVTYCNRGSWGGGGQPLKTILNPCLHIIKPRT